MAVSGVSGSSSSSSSTSGLVDPSKTGFNGLTADDFLKLLVTELQNQDPTQPVGNQELLQQISTMRDMQANIELSSTLTSIAQNQQVSSGAAFLGTVVTGTDDNQNAVSGVADRVFQQNKTMYVGIGTNSVQVSNITGVSFQQTPSSGTGN